MKIMQINCVYNYGSTGKITHDLHQYLQSRGIESVVCYGRRDKTSEPGVTKICSEVYAKANNLISRFTGLMYGGCFFSTNKLIKRIKKEQPDVVHLQCINGYFVNIYRLIAWLKDQKIKTVLTLHAEFMYTANCGHALDCDRWKTGCGNCPRLKKETKSILWDRTARSFQKMQQAFAGFDEHLTVVSVSPWLKNRAMQSPILKDKNHCVVFNGVDTDVFHPYNTEALRKRHGLTDEKILFHATPFFSNDPEHIKGGYYVLKLAEMLTDRNVTIFVAGDYEAGIQVPENVILLGRVEDETELARYYSMADVTVLTSKKETFSMVTAESLCCGTPVAGFRAGGPEQIAIPEFSRFVQWGEIVKVAEVIDDFLKENKKQNNVAQYAAQRYSRDTMTEGYLALYAK